jgi:hypothetical protein
MTFEIDPRVCLRTGKELAGSDSPCCGYDHLYTDRPSGLSAELSERAGYQDFRAKMTEKAQAGYGGEDALFTPEAYVMPPSPSDFREIRPAYQVEQLTAKVASSQRPLYVSPVPNRRDTFTAMLRRMFGRCPV